MVCDILSHYHDFCIHRDVLAKNSMGHLLSTSIRCGPAPVCLISLSVRFRCNLAFRGRTAMSKCNHVIYLI